MNKQQRFRIVCLYPDDTFVVQERMEDGSWMEAHRCLGHAANGLNEAHKWIDERREQ